MPFVCVCVKGWGGGEHDATTSYKPISRIRMWNGVVEERAEVESEGDARLLKSPPIIIAESCEIAVV